MALEIMAPTPEAEAELRSQFGQSASEWRLRAEAAGVAGRIADAVTYLRISEIAARVASGGALA